MQNEDAQSKVLECLKKEGQANTFRLTSKLGIDRHKLLNIIERLEEKQAVEFKSGKVRFLKFPREEKKVKIEVKKAPSAAKIEAKHKVKTSVQKSPEPSKKLKVLGSLQYENKKLKGKLSELEAHSKRQHYAKTKKFREQVGYIQKLEKRVEALKEKANVPPKIITRKIKVPPKVITKTIIKRVIKKVPVEVIKRVPVKVKETRKFKLPEFNIAWMKNVQQLSKPKILNQKISAGKPKIKFTEINKSIQQLNIPSIFKNN